MNRIMHAVVDVMMQKMLLTEPTMTPKIALLWSINAKKSLENHQGFSPTQITFGHQPRISSLISAASTGLEEISYYRFSGPARLGGAHCQVGIHQL